MAIKRVTKTATPAAAPKSAPKSEKPVKSAKPDTQAVEAPREMHSFTPAYVGGSVPLNTGKSKTPLRVAQFGTNPDLVMGERDLSILMPLYQRDPKTRQFPRLNADTGVLNRAISKGILKLVRGGVADPSAVLAFTQNPRES